MSELSKYSKSDLRGFFAILGDWLVIAFAVGVSEFLSNPLTTLFAIWIIGAKQYALGEVLVHEASHNNLFATRSWNSSLQFLFSGPFLRTVEMYRKEHLPHHSDLGGLRDPLCETFEDQGLNNGPLSLKSALQHWFFKPILFGGVLSFARDELLQEGWHYYRFHIFLYILVIFTCFQFDLLFEFFIYWVLPIFWCMPAFIHWQETDDHFNTIGLARNNVGVVRNYMTHNSGYHYVHHMNPTIPWFHTKFAAQHEYSDCKDVSSGFLGTFRAIMSPHEEDAFEICKNRLEK